MNPLVQISIPSDKDIYLEQTKLSMPYTYAQAYAKIRHSVIFTVVFFILGLLILVYGSELSTLFFAISIYGLVSMHTRRENYQRLTDNHLRQLRELLALREIDLSATLDFTDTSLRVHYKNLCSFHYWSEFEKLKKKKDHLLLIPSKDKRNTSVISKSELSGISFDELHRFLSEKI